MSGVELRVRVGWLLGALAVDLLLGEPPARWHPVVWLGRATTWFERQARFGRPAAELGWGLLATASVVAGAGAIGWLAERALARCPWPLRLVAGAWLLKTLLSVRALAEAAGWVEAALAAGDLPAARRGLTWLVSRDTSALDEPRLAAAAIESVAENLSDSLVGPAVAFGLFGLPGVAIYRAANTLDAMIGYRGRYEWFGKPAARLDDALNLAPSRLTALLIVLAAPLAGADPAAAAAGARRDGPATASPNAGWPMAAMAGALGVELEKRGHYVLGRGQRLPAAPDIGRAGRLLWTVVGLIGAAASVLGLIGRRRLAWSQRC